MLDQERWSLICAMYSGQQSQTSPLPVCQYVSALTQMGTKCCFPLPSSEQWSPEMEDTKISKIVQLYDLLQSQLMSWIWTNEELKCSNEVHV